MGKIILPHQSLTFDEIRARNWEEIDPYFSDSLRFCQDWLNGQTTFELTTSGSTGNPKIILVQRNQMEISAEATREFFQIPHNPRLLCCLNTAMIAGKMMLVRGMEWDADIYLVKPAADPFLENGLNGHFDFVAMVPLQVEKCLDDISNLNRLKAINNLLIGGAGLSPTLFKKIKEKQLKAFQSFGMTETVSHFALAKIDGEKLVYRTLPGVDVGTDESGKLWVKAPMAIESLLRTNDLVEIIAENNFVWKGRADFTINSGGVKIQPETLETQIEPLIQSQLGNISFIIAGKEDALLGQKVILLLEMQKISDSETEAIFRLLKEYIPKYHIPKEIHCLPEFEKTRSGKVNRLKTFKKLI